MENLRYRLGATANVVWLPIINVYPSVADFVRTSAAIIPLAPGRFSTRTDCPSPSDIFCARILATTSVPPPAEKPTSILIGLSGNLGVCALPVPAARHSASARTSMRSIFMAVPRDQPHFDL